MKQLLLVPLFLLLTSSTSEPVIDNEPLLLGTIRLYQTSDRQIVLLYDGTLDHCHMKYAIDVLLSECDTMEQSKCEFEETFQGLHQIPLDELEIEEIQDTIATKRI